MRTTQYQFLPGASRQLQESVRNGPFQILENPPLRLVWPSNLADARDSLLVPAAALRALGQSVAIACEYDSGATASWPSEIRHALRNAAISVQLVKPTAGFLEYWLALDSDGNVRAWDAPVAKADFYFPSLTNLLAYQQHHSITCADAERGARLLPSLSNAMAPDPNGSWNHPFGGVHRALILFCQGYTGLFDLSHFLWAAALDCLFASKLDRRKWGTGAIVERLRLLWGDDFHPYENVEVAFHQTRPDRRLIDIGRDVFRLRNAYVHGLSIPQNWLSPSQAELESGYAYQLTECTEIILRMTLLRILEDPQLLNVFIDSDRLDAYF